MAPAAAPQPLPLPALLAECNRLLSKGESHLDATRREAERRRAEAEAAWAAAAEGSDDDAAAAAADVFALACRAAARLQQRHGRAPASGGAAARLQSAAAAHSACEAGLSAVPRCALLHVARARALELRAQLHISEWDAAERAGDARGRDAAQQRLQQACADLKDAAQEGLRHPPLRLPAALLDDERRDMEAHAAVAAPKGTQVPPFPYWELQQLCVHAAAPPAALFAPKQS